MLGRLVRLSWREYADLLPAFWQSLVVVVFLRYSGIAGTMERLERRFPKVERDDSDLERWRQRSRALKRAGRFLPDAKCLARAIALWGWMGRNGIFTVQVHIGVRSAEQGTQSHAWVVWRKQPVDETVQSIRSYTVAQKLPSGVRCKAK